MKCPRCGFDAPNTRFCPNCGLQMPVQQPTYQQPVPPVQNTPRAVPVQTADAHVVPMQSAARVTSVPSDAHLTAVTPPKSRNTSLLVAAIIIGAVVVSGIVIAVLSALVRMGGLMSIYPAMGALMFALVVIMTMFSAMTFDPRLSWDRQPESEHEES